MSLRMPATMPNITGFPASWYLAAVAFMSAKNWSMVSRSSWVIGVTVFAMCRILSLEQMLIAHMAYNTDSYVAMLHGERTSGSDLQGRCRLFVLQRTHYRDNHGFSFRQCHKQIRRFIFPALRSLRISISLRTGLYFS